jgi:type I restriction enzyme, R subunit
LQAPAQFSRVFWFLSHTCPLVQTKVNDMPAKTAATINAIAQQFIASGIEGLENPAIFQVPEVQRAGGLSALKLLGKPIEIIQETKVRLFAA